MKKISGLLSIVILLGLSACNNSSKENKAETGEAISQTSTVLDAVTYQVDTSSSILRWTGSKPTGEHHGTVKYSIGFIRVADNQVVGGSVIVNLRSIKNEDLEGSPDLQKKLVSHLKSVDFFNVRSYPEALFEIIEVDPLKDPVTIDGITTNYKVMGNLTMKGIKRSVGFDAKIEVDKDMLTVQVPEFIIDRTEWGIEYKSKKIHKELKDQFISDDMGISMEIHANKRK